MLRSTGAICFILGLSLTLLKASAQEDQIPRWKYAGPKIEVRGDIKLIEEQLYLRWYDDISRNTQDFLIQPSNSPDSEKLKELVGKVAQIRGDLSISDLKHERWVIKFPDYIQEVKEPSNLLIGNSNQVWFYASWRFGEKEQLRKELKTLKAHAQPRCYDSDYDSKPDSFLIFFDLLTLRGGKIDLLNTKHLQRLQPLEKGSIPVELGE
jgi:hypothetical protein